MKKKKKKLLFPKGSNCGHQTQLFQTYLQNYNKTIKKKTIEKVTNGFHLFLMV